MKFVFISLFIATSLLAYINSSEYSAPRSLGLGSKINGNIGLNETLYENPASIGFTKDYAIDASYGKEPKDNTDVIDLSIVDTKTSELAGGFSYRRSEKETDKMNSFYASLAERYQNMFSFGLAGKYLKTDFSGTKNNYYDFDAGILYALGETLGIGVTYKNIRKVNQDVAPEELVFGINAAFSYFYPTFNISKRMKDGLNDTLKLTYTSGLEIVTPFKASLRGGYRFEDATDDRYYALGGGYRAPKLSIDYGYEQNIKNRELFKHVLSLRVFM